MDRFRKIMETGSAIMLGIVLVLAFTLLLHNVWQVLTSM
jgi:hypothetical protein